MNLADAKAAGGHAYEEFICSLGAGLRAGDEPPADRRAWEVRREALRGAMFAAMGPFPDKPCDLEPKVVGVLKREGYRIEKILFQSRPDVWVTANAYVPEGRREKRRPSSPSTAISPGRDATRWCRPAVWGW